MIAFCRIVYMGVLTRISEEKIMITNVKLTTGDSVDGEGRPMRIHLEVDLYQPTKEEVSIVQKLMDGCLGRFEKK